MFNVGDIIKGLPSADAEYVVTTSQAICEVIPMTDQDIELISDWGHNEDTRVKIIRHGRYPFEVGMCYYVNSEHFELVKGE